MKKVLGFDSWTQGSNNYKRIAGELKKNGYELILVHLGSWGHDVRSSTEEIDGDLIIRDISYYKGKHFIEILEIESPEAVIFLSTTAFAHRAFNRYCKFLGIPTIHLYHGLIAVQSIESERLNPININSQLLILFDRLWVNLTKILPSYIKSLLVTKASLRDVRCLLTDISKKLMAKSYSGVAPLDSSTTIVCVYVDADINHAIDRYRITTERVFVIGNPDLINFNIQENFIGFRLRECPELSNECNEIIYIDNGLIDIGAVFVNSLDYLSHIKSTKDAINKAGFKFSIKLHPVHYRTGLIELLNNENIEIIDKENFITRLLTAKSCIVEPSSAAIIPAIIGIPILLAKYGKLNSQDYGNVLTSYPLSADLKSLDQISEQLDFVNQKSSGESIDNWIKQNIGPLPIGMFSVRFFDAFKQSLFLVKKNNA